MKNIDVELALSPYVALKLQRAMEQKKMTTSELMTIFALRGVAHHEAEEALK